MFESLGDKLGGVFDRLRGKGSLSEADVDAAMREIRVALLEADVALPVAKAFIEQVKEQAIGQDVLKSVTPGQQIVKIVHDALVDVLKSDNHDLNINVTPPATIMMVGLQGSGKTTSTAKIAKLLNDKHKKKVLMASLDTQRPAAQEQLRILGEQTGIETLSIIAGQNPEEIAKRALETGHLEGFDVVMLDTAGRLSIDGALMTELKNIGSFAKPSETLLVSDAMTGQDAVNTAKEFHDRIGITGIMLTRVDGDARGGAALSMKAVTGQPIKLIGTGEKWDEIEPFHPERIAGRILGMGDVVSLVEKAAETIDAEDAQKMAQKFQKGQFDFNDLLSHLRQMQKMGGMGSLMKMLPGIGKMAGQLEQAGVDDGFVKKQEAMILSMTKKERENPKLMNASRKKRVASGSGTSVQDINKLIKQHQQMQTMMKRVKKMGLGGAMNSLMGNMGNKGGAEMPDMLGDAIGGDMDMLANAMNSKAEEDLGPLGANPFAEGGALPQNLPGGLPGAFPGLSGLGGNMGSLPTRGGSKKNRRKKGKRK